VKRLWAVILPLVLCAPVAWAQMPDLKTMAGRPLPVADLPAGTVSIRVARKIPSDAVKLVNVVATLSDAEGNRTTQTSPTGDDGRATFEGIAPGTVFHAEAEVDGERLTSSNFLVPEAGGIRIMLIAGIAAEPTPMDEAPIDLGQKQSRFEISAMVGKVDEAGELAAGILDIRVMDAQGKPLGNQLVRVAQMAKDGAVKAFEATTNSTGTARLTDLPTGEEFGFVAVTELGGIRVGSRPFRMSATSGMRTLLEPLKTTKDTSKLQTASPSYIVMEYREGGVVVQENLTIHNTGDALYDPKPGSLRFDLPTGFVQAQAMAEGTPLELEPGVAMMMRASIMPTAGSRAETAARFAFLMPTDSDAALVFTQKFPVSLTETLLLIPEGPMGKLEVKGEGIEYVDARKMETGVSVHRYKMPDLKAGQPITFTVSGYPILSRTGHRATAILVALLVLFAIVGTLTVRKRTDETIAQRNDLEKRREKLFADLQTIEAQRLSGRDDPAMTDRRQDLVGKLESIYKELATLDRGRTG
jgi:hypothetical protein